MTIGYLRLVEATSWFNNNHDGAVVLQALHVFTRFISGMHTRVPGGCQCSDQASELGL